MPYLFFWGGLTWYLKTIETLTSTRNWNCSVRYCSRISINLKTGKKSMKTKAQILNHLPLSVYSSIHQNTNFDAIMSSCVIGRSVESFTTLTDIWFPQCPHSPLCQSPLAGYACDPSDGWTSFLKSNVKVKHNTCSTLCYIIMLWQGIFYEHFLP